MATTAGTEERSPDRAPASEGGGGPLRARGSGWVWMALACILVGASGLVRTFQDRQYGIVKSSVPPCPFPLDRLPARIGEWTSLAKADVKLDPQTVRITGSTDHISRTYLDEMTGAFFSVLVLYGPAEPVAPHTPEICYPATGYAAEDKPAEFVLPLEGQAARFREAIYTKTGGGRTDRAKVYYSFRLDGRWAPDLAIGKRFHRTNAGIIKVQIQRLLGPGEIAKAANEPVEAFLAALIPEIEGQIARGDDNPVRSASR